MAEGNLLEKVAGVTRRCLPTGGPLVVAVSGGADSVCLLHTLAQLQDELTLQLHVAHLNHSLRGAESDADAEYVTDLSRKLNLLCTVEKRDISSYGSTSSLEEKARHARYTFLSELATTVGAKAIAVAHTADDQMETILMHLVRGTGLAGLCGMREVSTWKSSPNESGTTIIRPLLGVTQKEVEIYCDAYDLASRLDSSNKSFDYMRNRFRYELIPLIKDYNANFRDAVLRLASVVADEITLLDEQVSQVWDTVVRYESNLLYIDRAASSKLPAAVKRHLMRRVLERLTGTLTDIELVHIDSMLAIMEKSVGKKLPLPYDLMLVNDYNTCAIGREDLFNDIGEVLEGEYALNVPGNTIIPGWRIISSIENNVVDSDNKAGFIGRFDYDVVADDLIVRGKRPGDKLKPLGMKGSKSIKDLMIDLKVPKDQRAGIPIVCSQKHIVWIVGYRIDEHAKVSATTERVLSIKFERIYIDGV